MANTNLANRLAMIATRTTFLSLLVAVGNTSVANAIDPIIFTQSPDSGLDSLASQNATNPGGGGNFATAYDNFSFNDSHFVTGVEWQGNYFNGTIADGLVSDFTISIFEDNGGEPADIALFSDFIMGNANETLENAGTETYNYSTDLGDEFFAQAGQTYWLAIVPNLVRPPQWGWSGSSDGDSVSYQDLQAIRDQFPQDLAFNLAGRLADTPTTTPEPSSFLGLLSICALGVGLKSKHQLK